MVKQFNIKKIITIFVVCLVLMIIIYSAYTQIEDYKNSTDSKLIEIKRIFVDFFKQERKWKGSLKMLNTRDIMNEISLYRGDKSYTLNKERVHLCIKDENNEYYHNSMLIYVLAHELSHVLCESIGHTDEFNRIFRELLEELVDAGIHDPSYRLIDDYCHSGDKLQ